MPSLNQNWRQRGPGFTLVEILISLFLILAIITILLTTSGTYLSSHGANLQGTAAKIAKAQIETLRKTDFDSLPASGSFSDPDLAKLPAGTATRTVTNYQTSSDIKQVEVKIEWQVSGSVKNLKLETLIYRYGL